MSMRALSLDMDGVLTTPDSRQLNGTLFDPRPLRAMRRLLREMQPDVIAIHSSWRKLPRPPPVAGPPWEFPTPDDWWFWSLDWFRELCRYQGLPELGDHKNIVVPQFKFSSNRGQEIAWWIEEDSPRWPHDTKVVVVDDEPATIHKALEVPGRERWAEYVRVVWTDDAQGLTELQVDGVLKWCNGTETSKQ